MLTTTGGGTGTLVGAPAESGDGERPGVEVESVFIVLPTYELPYVTRMANNLTISHCTSHENLNGQPAFTSNDGCGFDLDGGVTNSAVSTKVKRGTSVSTKHPTKYSPLVLRRWSTPSPSGMPALAFSSATLARR